MLKGAVSYADWHFSRYGSKIGDDGVLGPAWAEVLKSLLTLLNGELGRLDGGTLDGLIRGMLDAEGFTDE